MARRARRDGGAPGPPARLPHGVDPRQGRPRQGTAAEAAAAGESALFLLGERAPHPGAQAGCGAGPRRLRRVPGRDDGVAAQSAPCAPRAECGRRPREPGSLQRERQGDGCVPAGARLGRMDRQPCARRDRCHGAAAGSLSGQERTDEDPGGRRQSRRPGAERGGAQGARAAFDARIDGAPVRREAPAGPQAELRGCRGGGGARCLHRRHGAAIRRSRSRDLSRGRRHDRGALGRRHGEHPGALSRTPSTITRAPMRASSPRRAPRSWCRSAR